MSKRFKKYLISLCGEGTQNKEVPGQLYPYDLCMWPSRALHMPHGLMVFFGLGFPSTLLCSFSMSVQVGCSYPEELKLLLAAVVSCSLSLLSAFLMHKHSGRAQETKKSPKCRIAITHSNN